MLYTKIQSQSKLGSGEEDFYVFLPYMGKSAWLNDLDLEQIFNPLLTEGSTWTLKKIGPGVSEEKSFKCVDGRRTANIQNS